MRVQATAETLDVEELACELENFQNVDYLTNRIERLESFWEER